MAVLVGARNQNAPDDVYAMTITVGSGGGSYLVLPRSRNRSFLEISSPSGVGYVSVGAGEATATISGGAVTAITVVDGGFNYTLPPTIRLLGGGNEANPTFIGATANPDYLAPGSTAGAQPNGFASTGGFPATAAATITSGAISAITVLTGGSGYVTAPFVQIVNNPNDPNGCANPFRGSVPTGRVVTSGNPLYYSGTGVPTSAIGLYCATSGSVFLIKWLP